MKDSTKIKLKKVGHFTVAALPYVVGAAMPITIFVLSKKNQNLSKNLKMCDEAYHEVVDAHLTLKENYKSVSERLLFQFMEEVPEVYIQKNAS